jgi:UDP-N-acetylmuramyl pentapeptide phosphotransferase/UDP-N-acetylglucosamine-1-phosphate transferase
MHADPKLVWTLLSLLAFGLSWLGARQILRRLGDRLIDVPNARSSHTKPTPRGGGIAFVGAFFVALGVASVIMPEQAGSDHVFAKILLVLLPLWLVGALDDAGDITASLRFAVQLAAGALAVFWFGPFPGFDDLLSSAAPSWASAIISVIAVTAIINFYNFMDGLDGLVAGTSAIQFVFLASYLSQPGWWPLVAALAGFLLLNWPPAKIFMGDSGSTVLGAAVALALLQAPSARSMWCAGAVTAPILGDATFTLIRRISKRENVLVAHKSHIYQRLAQSGWSHANVSAVYCGATLAIAVLVAALS